MKSRKELRENLLDKGIQTGYHYLPNHWLSFYEKNPVIPLTNSELIFPELLSLPLHPDLSIDDVKYVAKELIKII
jgi:dTDP-4-amino-4,6-dideoxygalactose transaminase